MSRLSSAMIEARVFTNHEQEELRRPKPVLVHNRTNNSADWVTRRVIEVMDLELANGSMPA